MDIKVDRIKKDIETLASFTSTPSIGVTRLPFTEEDRRAREYLKEQMLKEGLYVWEDSVGTLMGKRHGTDPEAPAIMLGSHYDTVKNAGAFDGVAGIVAGLEAIRALNEGHISTKNPIVIVAMNDEEGVRFKSGMLSSRAIVGDFPEKELDISVDEDGISLRQAMEDFGVKADLDRAKWDKNSIKAFLELHIEQGPVLESKNTEIGIVESIVGFVAYKIIIEGQAGHAGTTPMDLRSDALVAASKSILELNTIAKDCGRDTVATVGELNVLPGAANVIPGHVDFTVDIRSSDDLKIKELARRFEDQLKIIERDFKVKMDVQKTFYSAPIKLADPIKDLIEKEAATLGYTSIRMDSGAGHDSMIMADYVPTGMIFVPSKNGISHTPEEWTDYEQIQKGTELLLHTIIGLGK